MKKTYKSPPFNGFLAAAEEMKKQNPQSVAQYFPMAETGHDPSHIDR
ncbi:MAG: hypothetical protein HUJ80_06625 [Firmicutes bacterium]|nr:hypothetical protein [Bacillota bacterium]